MTTLPVPAGDSNTRVARIEDAYRALNRHDLGPFLSILDPQVVVVNPTLGNPVGVEAVRALYGSLLLAFPDLHVRVDEILVDGDRTVTRLAVDGIHQGTYGRYQATGRPVHIPMCNVAEWDGEHIVTWQSYWDQLAALQQLGLA